MLDLITALKTAFAADATVNTAIPGGLYMDKTSPGRSMPYCTIEDLKGQTLAQTFGTAYLEPNTYTFAVYADGGTSSTVGGAEAALTAIEALAAFLDRTSLSFNGTRAKFVRTAAVTLSDKPQNINGKTVFKASVPYRTIVFRNFPR